MDKQNLDNALSKLKIQFVGSGYVDCICFKEYISNFTDEMDRLNITIVGVSWWCHVVDGHKACGLGGPTAEFAEGWYSEIVDEYECFEDNKSVRDYLFDSFPKSGKLRPCMIPSFCLGVPDEWKNIRHS